MKNKIIIISILILIYACKNKQVAEEISEPTLIENTVGLSTTQLKNANIESNLLEHRHSRRPTVYPTATGLSISQIKITFCRSGIQSSKRIKSESSYK